MASNTINFDLQQYQFTTNKFVQAVPASSTNIANITTSKRKLSSKPHPKLKFTQEEDDLLKKVVEQLGSADWDSISEKIPGRNPRQCKERWTNYLSPDVNSKPWTCEEDAQLKNLYKDLGAKWVRIASSFKGRSDTMIKNRFMVLQRRAKVGVSSDDQLARKKYEKKHQAKIQQKSQQQQQVVSAIAVSQQTIVPQMQMPQSIHFIPQAQQQQLQQLQQNYNSSNRSYEEEAKPSHHYIQNDENEINAEDEADFWGDIFNASSFEQGCEFDGFGW